MTITITISLYNIPQGGNKKEKDKNSTKRNGEEEKEIGLCFSLPLLIQCLHKKNKRKKNSGIMFNIGRKV